MPGFIVFDTDASTWTHAIVEGGHTLSTETTTISESEPPEDTNVPDIEVTTIFSEIFNFQTVINLTPPTPPNCSLSIVEPKCQSSWDSFASNNVNHNGSSISAPLCSQALIGGSLCSSLQSSYAAAGFNKYNEEVTQDPYDYLLYSGTKWMIIGGSSVDVSWNNYGFYESTITGFWPSNSSIAPGCTIGCGQCAITGGTIALIHWPPATADGSINQDSIVSALNTIFTSPTVYVSFASLYAGNSCSRIGTSFTNTIIPISDLNELSSIWVDFEQGVGTASFNTADLNEPVPQSIFDRQPWCAAYSQTFFSSRERYGCGSNRWNTSCSPLCPRSRPYEPIIVLPKDVLRSLDPAWAACNLELRGAYDPPYLLTPQSVAAHPTAAPMPFSNAPTPAQGPTMLPKPTSDPGDPRPTPHPAPVQAPTLNGPKPSIDPRPSSKSPPQNDPNLSGNPRPPVSAPNDPHQIAGSIMPFLGSSSPQTPHDPPGDPSPAGSGQGDPAKGEPVTSGNINGNLDPGTGGNTGSSSSDSQDDPGQSRPGGSDPGRPGSGNVGSGEVSGSNAGGDPGNGQGSNPGAGSGADPQSSFEGSGGSVSSNVGHQVGSPSNDPGSNIVAAANGRPIDSTDHGRGANTRSHVNGASGNDGFSNGGSVTGAGSGDFGSFDHPASVNIGDMPAFADPKNAGIVIGGQTLTPDTATVIGGSHISVGNDGHVVIDGSLISLPIPATVNPGGHPISTKPEGPGVVVGGTTFLPGTSTIIRGSHISTGPGGNVIIDGSSISLPKWASNRVAEMLEDAAHNPPGGGGVAVFTLGGNTYTAHPGLPLSIGSTTIFPNGPGSTVDKQRISINDAGVQIGNAFIPFSPSSNIAAFSIGSQAYIATSGEPLTVGTAIIMGTGPARTISGHVISIAPSGIVVDGTTVAYNSAPTPPSSLAEEAIFTISGTPYTAIPDPSHASGEFIIGLSGTITLAPGATTSLGGQIISAVSDGIIVGHSTIRFSTVETGVVLTVGGKLYTAIEEPNPQGTGEIVVIDGSITITENGSPVSISGHVFSAGSRGVVVDGKTTASWENVTLGPDETPLATATGKGAISTPAQTETNRGSIPTSTSTSAEAGGGRLKISLALALVLLLLAPLSAIL
ncbi:MAG: hypothetical protein M1821_002497 [Bathelium mastoideum]|nr:MAG: hypothetical protein M1821_002497 [Bathelium mastoideum]